MRAHLLFKTLNMYSSIQTDTYCHNIYYILSLPAFEASAFLLFWHLGYNHWS